MTERDYALKLKLKPKERVRLAQAARRAGMSTTDYARKIALDGIGRRARLKHWNDSPKHEAIATSIFARLQAAGLAELMLFVFDFGDEGFVAFKTDIDLSAARLTVEALVRHVDTGEEIDARRPMSPATFEQARDIIATMLPEGIGYACVFGKGELAGYFSNTDRADVKRLLVDDVLPKWTEKALAVAKEQLNYSTVMRDRARDELVDVMTPELREDMLRAEERITRVVLPPPTSTSNIETLMMAWAYVYGPVCRYQEGAAAILGITAASEKLWSASRKFEALAPLAYVKPDKTRLDLTSSGLMQMFAGRWLESAYARLEVGHKLAASLCLTDVPDDLEVRAPWAAWSLVLPDGILSDAGITLSDGTTHGPLARVWLLGITIVCVVTQAGVIVGAGDDASCDRAHP